MRIPNLHRRVEALEARQAASSAPSWCSWERRLAKYNAFFVGLPWTCPGPMTPEREAWKEAKLARYKEYFDAL
jgi:hypothetical protein